jgi:uncharacterized NAD(P)/FAD-binding protein YdhS
MIKPKRTTKNQVGHGQRMSNSPSRRIVIVGGGASGALMAAHLLRERPPNLGVSIVETRAQLGRGLAYATGNPSHLLNVRAANMSAFADDPGHFARWLSTQGDAPAADDDPEFRFVSRGLYGRYLESLVLEHLGLEDRPALTSVRDQAREVTVTASGVEVRLASGPPIHADIAILACGHEGFADDNPLYVNPWSEPVGGGAPIDATLLILGTGLTMVDTALALEEQGHRGRIVALSRRGLLPHTHRPVEPLHVDATSAPLDQDLPTMLAWLRRLASECETGGGDWRSVVDGLRPHTQTIWRLMTPHRRERFLEHARPWWDIHRHRMAPEVAARLAAMIANGRLEIVAGRILEALPDGDDARVALRRRGSMAIESLRVSGIISCKGVASDPGRSANPLVASLFIKGLARADKLRIGLEVDAHCAILDRDGRASPRLFAIGPMSQAAFWEIVAVPDIRLQTAALSARILAGFGEARTGTAVTDEGRRGATARRRAAKPKN